MAHRTGMLMSIFHYGPGGTCPRLAHTPAICDCWESGPPFHSSSAAVSPMGGMLFSLNEAPMPRPPSGSGSARLLLAGRSTGVCPVGISCRVRVRPYLLAWQVSMPPQVARRIRRWWGRVIPGIRLQHETPRGTPFALQYPLRYRR